VLVTIPVIIYIWAAASTAPGQRRHPRLFIAGIGTIPQVAVIGSGVDADAEILLGALVAWWRPACGCSSAQCRCPWAARSS
jgi:hypothetical protein